MRSRPPTSALGPGSNPAICHRSPVASKTCPGSCQGGQVTGGPTEHLIREGDARDLSWIETESVHLVCTSPPYGPLKEYPDHPGQLGNMPVYDEFLDELDKVWRESL